MTDLLKTTSPENQALIATHAARRDMARECGNTLGEQLEITQSEWRHLLGKIDGLSSAIDAIERHMAHWADPEKKLSRIAIRERRTATDYALETLSKLRELAEKDHQRASGARAALDLAFTQAEREHTLQNQALESVMKAVVAERDKPPAPTERKPTRKTGTHPGKSMAAKRRAEATK